MIFNKNDLLTVQISAIPQPFIYTILSQISSIILI
ncbi:protein of unknown function [Xenorhabdus doucetiae]|uniref:Uncharacterized protein n=1 Tax=Xenorhabdus doucetiae TaxID=351671 RepID=A0A068QR19_9GAMM|nr:protein of unknown function [Xenorhabdus doucetiae]